MRDSTAQGKVPTPADVAAAIGKDVPVADKPESAAENDQVVDEVDKPWNDTDNPYDPDRAARLIHNLREEKRVLQQRLDERPANADVESLARQYDQLAAENKELRGIVVEFQRVRALNEAGIGEEFRDLVQGDTPEEISYSVQRLAALQNSATRNDQGGVVVTEPAQAAVDNEPVSTNDKWRRAFGF